MVTIQESVQKLIGASNLDLEKFPITMTSTQTIARVNGGNVEVISTHKQHDNTFGGLFPKPFNDLLLTSLPLSFMKEDILFNVWKLEVKGLGVVVTFRHRTISYGGLSHSSTVKHC